MSIFRTFGRTIIRFRWFVILGWIAASVVLALTVPPLSSLTSNELQKFLPNSEDSVKARALLREYFPYDNTESSIVIVLEGKKEIIKAVSDPYIEGLSQWLTGPLAPPHILGVRSALTNPELAERFQSKDGEAVFMVVNLDTSFISPETVTVTKVIERQLNPPPGTRVYLTGDGVLGHDYTEAINISINRSTLITILLVIALLLFIYRSPITPFVSLIPVCIAFVITRCVLALVALSGVSLPDTLNLFLIVLLFGAGTDYCVFLIGRFREELEKCSDPKEAAVLTTCHVGEAITSSAGTITVGLSVMALAKFGAINTIGPCLAAGIIITLLSSITLVPAILSILGERAFWPRRVNGVLHESVILDYISRKVVLAPRKMLILGLLLPLPFVFFMTKMHRSYDLFAELPAGAWSVRGFKTLEKHFPPGEIAPVTVVVKSETEFSEPATFDDLYRLSTLIQGTDRISKVFSPSQPLGERATMRALAVPEQIHKIVSGVTRAQDGVERQIAGTKRIAGGVERILATVDEKYQQSLPVIREFGRGEYDNAKENIGKLHAGVLQLEGSLEKLHAGLGEIKGVLGGYQDVSAEQTRYLDHLYLPPDILEKNSDIQKVFKAFISPDKHAAKIVVLQKDSLYSREALNAVQAMRKRINSFLDLYPSSVVKVHLNGANPMMADIRSVTIKDQKHIILASVCGILLILLLLFRQIWVPTYLLVTMIFSFVVTMGVTVGIFQYWFGTTGLDWKVPFLGFVLLVSLGVDYNILIMYRIREEREKLDMRESIHKALSKAGGVIMAAGVILAGTFSSLLFTPLHLMQQIGFAVTFGLLFVTFVVVTIIVPSIALLTDEWRVKRLAQLSKDRSI